MRGAGNDDDAGGERPKAAAQTQPLGSPKQLVDRPVVDKKTVMTPADPVLLAASARDEANDTSRVNTRESLVVASLRSDPPGPPSRPSASPLPAPGRASRSSAIDVDLEGFAPNPRVVPRKNPKALLGAELGHYTIDSLIAITGTCAVYKASHRTLGTPAAIKVLIAPPPDEEHATDRFLREARAAARLQHHAFARIHDCAVTDDGLAFFVMELLEGETLEARISREKRLPAKLVVEIGVALAEALGALHAEGWIHRDVKPSNVFLVKGGKKTEVKLLDLGVVRHTKVDAEGEVAVKKPEGRRGPTMRTVAGVVLGTPLYMSPEQILGEELDGRSDLYGLGVVLYEALAGSPPFRSGPILELLSAHLNDPPQPISVRAPEAEVPVEVEKVVLRALSKDREARAETAALMASELRASMGLEKPMAGAPLSVMLPSSRPSGPSPVPAEPKRGSGMILAAVVVLAALAAAAAWMLLKTPDAVPPPKEKVASARVVPPPPPSAPAAVVTVAPTASEAPAASGPPPSRIQKVEDLKNPF